MDGRWGGKYTQDKIPRTYMYMGIRKGTALLIAVFHLEVAERLSIMNKILYPTASSRLPIAST
jgi:hypothetical protein